MVERATNEKLAEWLEENPREGSQIVAKAISASRARMAAQGARDLTVERTRSTAQDYPASLWTARRTIHESANSSLSRATRPAALRRMHAIRAFRRFFRFAARS